MRAKLTAACIAMMCMVAQPGWAQAPQERPVAGTVKDAATDAPIANATVTVVETGETVTTGADGTFTVKATGKVTLRVTLADYDESTLVVEDAVATADVKLQKTVIPTRVVTGLIENETTGDPVAGAQVAIPGTELSAVTDPSGFFVIAGAPVTDVALSITATDLAPKNATISAATNSIRVRLAPATPPPPPPESKTRTITGRVLEKDSNEPIPGATIEVVGTEIVVLAEADGSFIIENAPSDAVTLQVSGAGHKKRAAFVPPTENAITVDLDLSSSETIIVTGRAPAIVRQNLANGASVVQGDDLNQVSSDNIESGMQGKITGANIQNNSGAPGGGIQLSLRGVSTINGRNTPLYVVDGVVVQNVAIANGLNAITGSAGGSNASNQDNPVNRIADIDPNDIASIEVLKGASAAALYGSKASNGVVIITTKRGQAGKAKVSFTQRIGFSQAANRLGFREFSSLEEAQDAFGVPEELYSPTPFDHEAEVFGRSDPAYETLGSMSGGDDKGTYAGSFLVRDTPGLLKNTGYQKQNGRIAFERKLGKKLSVGVASNFIHSNTQRGISNNDNTFTTPYFVLGGTPTFYDIRANDRGEFTTPNPFIPSGTNPLQTADLMVASLNGEEVYRTITSANAQLQLYSDDQHSVAASALLGIDFFNYAAGLFVPPEAFFEGGDGLLGTSVNTDAESRNYNLGSSLTWGFTPKSGAVRSAATLGFIYEDSKLDNVLVLSQNQVAGQPNVDQGTQTSVAQTRTLARDVGFYLKEELQLLDESLSIIGAGLVEASSNNGNAEQFSLYPKLGLVYSVPDLPEELKTVRLRAAYGETGNKPNFNSRFTQLAGGNLDGSQVLTQGLQVGDPNIEPERQREFDGGVDLVAWDNRLVVEFGGYYRAISNMLLNRRLGGSAGFQIQQFNGGGLRNVGAEAMLQVEPVKNDQWTWLSRTLFTMNRSKITDLPVPSFDVGGFGTGLGAFRIEKGQSATQIVADVPDGMGGTVVMKVGDSQPDFRMTFVNNVSYKDKKLGTIGLSSLLDWQKGSDVINLTQFIVDIFRNDDDFRDDNIGDGLPCSLSVGKGGSLEDIAAACGEGERRRESGPVNGNDAREYIEDASFLRVRELKLFWTMPDHIVKHLGPAEAVQLSVSARNLFTFTNYSGLDPEVSNFGNQAIARNIDVAPYPPSRIFWFSVRADF